jgi:hypothetical protein
MQHGLRTGMKLGAAEFAKGFEIHDESIEERDTIEAGRMLIQTTSQISA